MRILKFGGKSLENIQKMQNICKNIKKIYKNDKKIIIVVSAMGNTTNELETLASKFNPKKHAKRDYDALLSVGETKSCALFSIILNSMGVKSKSFQAWQIKINTHGDFQNSLIFNIDKAEIEKCLNSNTVAVIAGFQGLNNNNEITTLGRGGSDTTATAFGAVFDSDVEIYSDFDGIFAGDPRIENFKKLNYVDYTQMQYMSESGAKVIDSRALQIAKQFNTKLISKCSVTPNKSGTIISSIETNHISISLIDNLCEISILFSNQSQLFFIIKNVNFLTKFYKIYNLSLNSYKICLIVDKNNKEEIIKILSKKLNLIKENNSNYSNKQ